MNKTYPILTKWLLLFFLIQPLQADCHVVGYSLVNITSGKLLSFSRPLAPDIDVRGNGISIAMDDSSPSLGDGTDFGTTGICSDSVIHTFILQNTGMLTLTVSAITFSGMEAADFSVGGVSLPAVIAPGDSIAFNVKFVPGGIGLRTAFLDIANDDMDENPYSFAIQGTGVNPEINLKGNNQSIVDGDNTPSATDNTDFGSTNVAGGTVVHNFRILNTGIGSLKITSISKVGPQAAEFIIGPLLPPGPIPTGDSASFNVTFDPAAFGTRTATIRVHNIDCDETLYDFAVQGEGLGPEINVTGNTITIADGDATPSTADGTDFGGQCVSAGVQSRTFKIETTGNDLLILTGMPPVTIGGPHASDYTVVMSPNTLITNTTTASVTVEFNPSAPGIRQATLSINNNDSDENPYNFSIQGIGLDIFPTLNGSTTICSGASAALNVSIFGDGTPPYNVTLFDGTNFFTVGSYFSGNPIVVSPAATTTYTLIDVTDAMGCAATAAFGTATVVVNPLPDVTDPADQILCNGENTVGVNFTSMVPGATFTWVNNNPSIGLAASGTGNIPIFTAINNSLIPQIATITVTPTASGCAGAAQSFTYTVFPTPSVADPSNQAVCNGTNTTAVTFSGTVPGTIFSWANSTPSIGLPAFGSGNINAFTAVNNGASPVIATITVTPSANGCVGPPQNFTITVNPTPTVTDPSDQTLCNGVNTNAVTFSGPVAGTVFNWTNDTPSIGLAANGTGNINAFAAVNNGASPVTATITVTPVANGCAGPVQSFTITVNPTPTVADPSDQTLCNGVNTNAVLFNGSVAGTVFNWTNDTPSIGLAANGSGNINAFAAVNNGASPVTATITVTPVANGCTGPVQNFTITVNPTPTVADPPDQALCNGVNTNAVVFSGPVSGTVFNWTNDTPSIGLPANGSGNINAFAVVNNGATPVAATITVTPVANGCTGPVQSFTITVNPTPTVADPPDQTLCNGVNTNAVVFNGPVAGTVFNWTNNTPSIGLAANGSGNINAFAAVNNGATPVTATITVTPVANGCTGPVQSFTITVNPTPTVADPSDQTLCNGVNTNAVVFSGLVAGTVFNWTNDTPSIGLAANGSGNINAFAAVNNGAAPVTATITVTPVANGCAGPVQSFTITVNPTPTVADPSDQTLCNGVNTNAVVFSGLVAGTVFNWTNDTPSIGLAANGSGNINAFAAVNNGASPVTATITETPVANGCTGPVQNFTITVNPTPTVADPLDQFVCNGVTTAPVVFNGTVPGTTFAWTNNNSSVGLAASGSGNIPAFIGMNPFAMPNVALITVTPSALSCTGLAQTFSITVSASPIISCPQNVVQNLAGNQCTAAVSNIAPTVNLSCNGATVTYALSGATTGNGSNDAGQSLFNVGQTLVTYTVADGGANTSTCNFTVTIQDVQAPVITCPGAVIQQADPGLCTTVIQGVTPLFNDLCSAAQLAYQIQGGGSGLGTVSGLPFPSGNNTVIYTATDASGNTATCSFQITVNDLQVPVITCPANVIQLATPGMCQAIAGGINAVFSDNCNGASLTFATFGSTFVGGNGNASGTTFNVGQTTVVYQVTDVGANTASCSFEVLVQDQVAPTVTCPANVVLFTPLNQCFVLVGNLNAVFSDDCGIPSVSYAMSGATVANGIGSATGKSFNAGVTTLVYTVTDASSNTSTCATTVTIQDNVFPTITCPVNQPFNTDPGQCHAVVNGIDPVFADNCGVVMVNFSMTGATNATGVGSANGTGVLPGTTLVTYTAVDAASNSASCQFNVAVTDDEAPVINCPPAQTILVSNACNAIPANLAPLTADNCGINTLAYLISGATSGSGSNVVSGLPFELGISLVQYVVTDLSGNTSSCQTTVEVQDDSPPSFSCPVLAGVSCALVNHPVYADATAFTNAGGVFFDNCAVNPISFGLLTETSDQLSCPETIQRVYKVEDVAGNAATCSQTIVLNDVEAPVMTLLGDNPAFLCAGMPYAEAGVQALDNCGGNLSNQAVIFGSVDNQTPGNYLLVYEVTDACGNTAEVTRSVEVGANATFLITGVTCAPDLLTYEVTLNSDAIQLIASGGMVVNQGGGIYRVTAIPSGVDVQLIVTSAAGCNLSIPVTAPNCTCGSVSIPVSDGDRSSCAGAAIPSLSISGINTATETVDWYDAPSGGSLLASGTTQFVPSMAGTYWAETRNILAPLCVSSVRTAVSLTIHALPVVQFSIPATICNNAGALALAGSPLGGVFAGTGVNGSDFNPAVAPAGIQSISYSYTDMNGCVSVATQNIEVFAAPVADAGSDVSLCLPAAVGLNASATGVGPFSYQWAPTSSLSSLTISNPIATPPVTEAFTVFVTDGNGCTSSDQVSISINGLFTLDAGPDVSVCRGDVVQLQTSTNATGNLLYAWSPALPLTDPGIPNPVATLDSTTTFTLLLTDVADGCAVMDEMTITVLDIPVVEASSSSPICSGEALQLTETGGDGVSWNWTGPGGFFSDQPSVEISSGAVLAGDYEVVVSGVNGCTNSVSVPVAFVNGSGVSFEAKFLVAATACTGDTIRFIEISDTLGAAFTPTAFQWDFGDGSTSDERDPTHIYTVPGLYDVRATIYDQDCPNFTLVKTIEILACRQSPGVAHFLYTSLRPTLNTGEFDVVVQLIEPLETRFEVYNRFGRLMESRNVQASQSFQEQFNLREPGVYFVKIITGLTGATRVLKTIVVKP